MKPVVEAPPAATKGKSGNGLLTLVAQPYAQVSLNGRQLGATPLFKISLPRGKHTLKLTGEDGQPRALEVEIRDGETSTHRVQLEKLSAN